MPWTPRGWVDETGRPWQDPTQDPSLRFPMPSAPVAPVAPAVPNMPTGDIIDRSPMGTDGAGAFVPASSMSDVPGAGGGDPLVDLLRDLYKQKAASEGRLLDPEYQRGLSDIQVEAYRRMADIAQGAAMEKSRERSRREIELQNMKSWEAITRSQIDKEARLAESLARTAYIASTPNANVLSALAPVAQQSMAAYKQPQSVFPS
jgi:hypothetical protein